MHLENQNRRLVVCGICSVFTVTVVMLIIYAFKGIYPFGIKSVSYWDMSQSVIPSYYHTWDVLHGKKALLWDWYSGMGGSMTDRVGSYVLNPINLLFLFIKRDHIVEFMSVFLIIKMALSSFFMSFYISKKYSSIPIFGNLIGALSYATCGFVLQYYCFITFLDIVMIFPLIILSLDYLIEKDRIRYYVSLMILGFVTNIQLMYMICVYLIIKAFLDIRYKQKEDKTHIVSRLAIATILALLLSAWAWLPMVIQLMGSGRASIATTSGGYFSTLVSSVCTNPEQKLFMLYGSEGVLAIGSIILLERKELKAFSRHLIILVMLLLPIFVEGINILWHPGGYVSFPMRFGYMLSFEAICLSIEFFSSKRWCLWQDLSVYRRIAGYAAIVILPLFIAVLHAFTEGFLTFATLDSDAYNSYWLIILFSVVIVALACYSKNLKIAISVLAIIIVSQSLLGSYGFVAPEYSSVECNMDLLKNAVTVGNENGEEADLTIRYKNEDSSLITNWPLITRIPAVENWTWGTNPNIRRAMEQLGYSYNYTRFVDNGGTIFTDNLMGIKKLITSETPNDQLYSFYKSGEVTDYYNYKYSLPFGIVTESFLTQEFSEDVFDNQNRLFSEITGNEQLLIEEYDIEKIIVEDSENIEGEVQIIIPVEGKKTIYLYSLTGEYTYSFEINSVNKSLPFLMHKDNNTYPAFFRNGLIECGSYNDEDVHIVIHVQDTYGKGLEGWKNDLKIGGLDMQLLENEYEKLDNKQALDVKFDKKGLKITGRINEDGNLLLPIGYNIGWDIRVNDAGTEYFAAIKDAFLLIPVKKGDVTVDIRYKIPCLNWGVLLSVLAVMIVVLYEILAHKQTEKREVWAGKILYYMFLLLCYSIIVLMYVIPLIVGVINRLVSMR